MGRQYREGEERGCVPVVPRSGGAVEAGMMDGAGGEGACREVREAEAGEIA
jgi:hypothetical protein